MLTFTLTTQPQPSDLNRQSGLNAYRWMSMNPERRADSKNTAWQRMITPASMRSAKQIVGA